MDSRAKSAEFKCAGCGQPMSACLCATLRASPKLVAGEPSLAPVDGPCAVGSVLAQRYDLIAELGRGGMGVVYKAKHIALPKFFAVKVLNRELSSDPGLSARFMQEAKTASLLDHPNLVSIYDYGTTEYGESYLVMDFIDGQSLAEALTQMKRIEQREAVKIFMQICEGFSHAHGLGVIHRDLKPSNIMLINSRDGRNLVKVVDFGIAKMIGEEGGIAQIAQSLTKTGEFFGSPLYMSPEQGVGGVVDHRTDIYSLGILMYECLTSAPPFRGENFFATVMQHCEQEPRPFSKELGISKELEAIVFKALAKNPDERFQSMEELNEALQSVFPAKGERRGKRNGKKIDKGGQTGGKIRELKSGRLSIIASLVVFLAAALAGWFHFALNTNQHPQAAKNVASLSSGGEAHPSVFSGAKSGALAIKALPPLPDSVVLPPSAASLSVHELVAEGLRHQLPPSKPCDYIAAKYFMTAIEKDPDSFESYKALFDYYWRLYFDASEATKVEALRKCDIVSAEELGRFPQQYVCYQDRSGVLIYMQKLEMALTVCNRGIELDPDRPDLHIQKGWILQLLGRCKEAVTELEGRIRPTDRGSMYILGVCYHDLGRYQDGIDFCTKWIYQLDNPDSGLYMDRADCQFALKKYKDALSDFLKVKAMEEARSKTPYTQRDSDIAECRRRIASGDR